MDDDKARKLLAEKDKVIDELRCLYHQMNVIAAKECSEKERALTENEGLRQRIAFLEKKVEK
jgi:hypothetical protein